MVGSHPRNQIDGTQTDQSENGWYTDRSKEGTIRHVRNLEVQTAMRCRTEEPCCILKIALRHQCWSGFSWLWSGLQNLLKPVQWVLLIFLSGHVLPSAVLSNWIRIIISSSSLGYHETHRLLDVPDVSLTHASFEIQWKPLKNKTNLGQMFPTKTDTWKDVFVIYEKKTRKQQLYW